MQFDVPTAPLSVVPLLEPYLGLLLYALGLATVFLLGVRARWADRAMSLVLAVLWVFMALALLMAAALVSGRPVIWPPVPSAGWMWMPLLGLAVLFAIQSLLFVVEGM